MAKPAFDPSQPFEKAPVAAKPAFDPSQPFEKGDAPAGQPAQAALESFGNTASFGNLAQLQAGVSQVLPNPTAELDQNLANQGFKIQGPDTSYVAERDANIKRREGLEAENPKAALAGKVAGFAATVPALAGAGTAASFGGRALQAAKGGAIAGALTNPGDVEGEVANPLQEIGARGKQAAKGAATAALVQGAVEKVASPIASWIKGKLSGGAEKMAVKALNPTKSQVERLKVSGKENNLGRMLLDEGAIPKVGSTNAILNRVSEKKEQIGQKLGELLESAGDAKVISGKTLADTLSKSDDFAMLASTPGAEGLASKSEQILQTLRSKGEMSVREAHALRKSVDKLINFSKRNDDLRGVQELLYGIRSEVSTAINGAMNKVPGVSKDQLRRLNGAYSKLADAERIAEGGVARQAANQTFSLGDKVMATVGGLSGGFSGAAAAAGANKLARTYGRSTAARTMDLGSKVAGGVQRGIEKGAASPAIQAMIARLSAPKTSFEESEIPVQLQDPKVLGTLRKNPALIDQIQDPKVREQVRRLLDRTPSGD